MNNDQIDKANTVVINNIELGKNIIAAQYLKEASDLLKYDEEQISTLLLQLAKLCLDKTHFTNVEMAVIKTIVNEIRNGESKD